MKVSSRKNKNGSNVRELQRDKLRGLLMRHRRIQEQLTALVKDYVTEYSEFRVMQDNGHYQKLKLTAKAEGVDLVKYANLIGVYVDPNRPVPHDLILGCQIIGEDGEDEGTIQITTAETEVEIIAQEADTATRLELNKRKDLRMQRGKDLLDKMERDNGSGEEE